MITGAADSNSFVNTGQATGIAVGGAGNRVEVTGVAQAQDHLPPAELREVLARLEQGRHNAQELEDLERVRASLAHAEAGRPEAARTALQGVGRWVLEIARQSGASVLTKELTALLS